MINSAKAFQFSRLIALGVLCFAQLLTIDRVQSAGTPASQQRQLSEPVRSEGKKRIAGAVADLPLRFELAARQQDRRVKFVGRANGNGVFLTETGAVFTLRSN